MIPEAWVTHADAGYAGLAGILIRSLAAFSSRPVFVYGVDTNINTADLANVAHAQRIPSAGGVKALKFTAMLDAAERAERLIYLDADVVANYTIDELWGWFSRRRRNDAPMISDHTVLHGNAFATRFEQITGTTITRPWGHSCAIWFTRECGPFFRVCRCIERAAERLHPETGDESVINACLEHFGVMDNAPLCTHSFMFLSKYLSQSPHTVAELGESPEVYYHMFHGCHVAKRAAEVFEAIRDVRLPVHFLRGDAPNV